MSEKHKCCQRVWPEGTYRGYPCDRGAAYEHEGKWYCKTHHPPTVKAKTDARNAKYEAEWKERSELAKAAADAAAEQKRKADAYDQLAERNAELVEALLNLYYYVSTNIDSGFPKGIHISGSEFVEARAALAKCQPKPQEVK